MAAALARHDELVTGALDRFGQKVHGTGDGFLYAFDTAPTAVAAAVATQQALTDGPWVGEALEARIGITFGPAQPRADDFFGPTVNRCARVMSAGGGGQILASEEVAEQLTEAADVDFTLHDHGRCRLKDLALPVRLFEIVLPGREPTPPVALARVEDTLPRPRTSFVGRTADLAALPALLAEHRLVTLTGPGGVGKTRLAIELAESYRHHFDDGAWFVPFETLAEGDGVIDLMAKTIGVRPVDGLDTRIRLMDALRRRPSFAVLDCCEHVLTDVRQLVGELLAAELDLTLLVTSRRRLGLAGEQTWEVGPLSVTVPSRIEAAGRPRGDAVELFMQRASDLGTGIDWANPEQQRAVDEIVYRISGLPLAIELIAARVGSLTPVELLARLGDIGAMEDRSDRHRRHKTIDATIEWSDRLLSDPAQTLLRRLTCFASPPDIDAVEACCGDDLASPVHEVVDELIEASLLTLRRDGSDRTRYRLFDTVRTYAVARWPTADREATEERHAGWVRDRSAALGPMVQLDVASMQQLRDMQPDLQQGVDWLFTNDRLRDAAATAADLAVFWVVTGQAARGRAMLERALEARLSDPLQEAAVLQGAGIAAALDADYQRSDELLADAAAALRALQRERRAAYPDFWRARSRIVQAFHGMVDADGLRAGTDLLERCLAVFRERGDLFGLILSLPYLAWGRMLQGSDDAWEPIHEALDLATAPGLERVEAYANAHLAHLALVLDNDPDEARALLAGSMDLLREAGDRQNILICQLLMAGIELRSDRELDATAAIAEAAGIAAGGGSREWEADVVALALPVAVRRGDLLFAAELTGLLADELPTWPTVLANIGVGHLAAEAEAAIGGLGTTARRAAARTGRRRGLQPTLELIAADRARSIHAR
ncbi:MAG: adenylate/guanylate cyclase domain-containing protein, partial [Actinomycetota bacterium]